MKASISLATAALLVLPSVSAWGSLGHITTAFIASHFVSNSTEAFLQDLLDNKEHDYLAKVASWADSIRYTKWGHFTSTFHFIDAHDNPPFSCDVDFDRDCKATGCVINALANYTIQSVDTDLAAWRRAQAAKFVIHFIGDLHQPLHNEDVSRGGNGIHVKFDDKEWNLHHVWDSSIAEKMLGIRHTKPYTHAFKWANQLSVEISDGKYAAQKESWLESLDFTDPIATAMAWSRQTNAYVCSHVFPEGPHAIVGQELGGEYFEKAAPIIELQVARAGLRMAVWLDHIVDGFKARLQDSAMSEEL